MELNEYQTKASAFMNPQCSNYAYLSLGLAGECGEVCDKLKRLIRGDGKIDDTLLYELGDVLWYLSQLSDFFKISLEQVAQTNIDKLTARKDSGTICGTGDKR